MISEYTPPDCSEQDSQSQSHTHDITSPTPVVSPGSTIAHPIETPIQPASAEYTSPTGFFSPDGPSALYDPNPSNIGRHDSYDSNASFGYSSYGSIPSTSHSMQSFGGGDEGGTFWGYDTSNPSMPSATFAFRPSELDDHATPGASGHIDDDRTPIVPDHQRHTTIHPSQLPSPHDASIMRASAPVSATLAKPLLSPFRSFGHQHQHESAFTHYPSMPINDPNTFMGAPSPYYSHPSQSQLPMGYSSPYDPPFAGMQMGFAQPQHHMGYSQPIYAPQPTQPAYGPPRSQNGSPTGSITSSVASTSVSVKRSQSLASDFRPPRPKLTKEDKRAIVELHKNNTALRQEDIARRYGTISKIIIAKHRWEAPDDVPAPPVVRQPKSLAGRFPEVDKLMSEWMDQQIAIGADVRDPIAREQAKIFAREVGLDDQRFKASAKWLDKFKDRRKLAGKPISSSPHYANQPYASSPYINMSFPRQPYNDAVGLSRSHSAVTLGSSSSSSQEQYIQSPACVPSDRLVFTRSEPDLIHTAPVSAPLPPLAQVAFPDPPPVPEPSYIESTPQAQARARSQSSPHNLNTITMQTPSSGKHVRPSPLALQRQNSYHGSSPSPRRPLPPSRANSTQGPLRRSRPGSLAASAFGITALDGDGSYSPSHSPTTSTSGSIGGHSRQRSECLTPFTASMATMAISPDVDSGDLIHSASTSSVSSMPTPLAVPPHTPITPLNASAHGGAFPTLNPDGGYADIQQQYQHHHQQLQQQQQQHRQQLQQGAAQPSPYQAQQYAASVGAGRVGHTPLQGYASMPNKHYGTMGAYPADSPTEEFGQAYGRQVEVQGYPDREEQRWS